MAYTGQHFDNNVSEQFFKELEIPNPDYNLGISEDTHAQVNGRMMIVIEDLSMRRAVLLQQRNKFNYVLLTGPVGYPERACLVSNAQIVVTDSGGLKAESFFEEKKCLKILDFVCWPETMVDGRNELSRNKSEEILGKLSNPQMIND